MQPLQPADPFDVGPYTLLARLGAGGMGRVYLGRSPGGRLVAIKVVREELAQDTQFRDRFRQEIAAMRRVGGFWTATVVDADTESAAPWMASAYVPGPSLAEVVRSCGPLPVHSARLLACGLAEALGAIHAAGLVHRDLKPSNVLLASDGPRVIDFGIARAMDDTRLTGTGHMVGTPGFVSPEQAKGEAVGPPGDIFCLGLILAFCTTGSSVYGSGSSLDLLYRVVHETPDLSGVPDELREVIARCLDRTPARRPDAVSLVAMLGADGGTAPGGAGGWLPAQATELTRRYEREAEAARTAQLHRTTEPHTTALTADHSTAGAGFVFRDSTGRRITAGVLGALLPIALVSAVVASGGPLAVAVAAMLLGMLGGAPLLRRALARRDWLRVGPDGIEARAREFRGTIPWETVERVAVIRARSRLWVVAWTAAGYAAPVGTRARAAFGGGYRLFTFPPASRARREIQVLEVSSALVQYSRGRFQQ